MLARRSAARRTSVAVRPVPGPAWSSRSLRLRRTAMTLTAPRAPHPIGDLGNHLDIHPDLGQACACSSVSRPCASREQPSVRSSWRSPPCEPSRDADGMVPIALPPRSVKGSSPLRGPYRQTARAVDLIEYEHLASRCGGVGQAGVLAVHGVTEPVELEVVARAAVDLLAA